MAKSVFPQAVEDLYKLKEREIKIKGDLVFDKYQSHNLTPDLNYTYTYAGGTMTFQGSTITLQNWNADSLGGIDNSSFTLDAGTYTFHIITDTETSGVLLNLTISFIHLENGNPVLIASINNLENSVSTITLNNQTTIDYMAYEVYTYYGPLNTNIYKLMINSGSTPMEYEQEGEIEDKITLGEDGICQILDFGVDETSDLYYEKMPFSELYVEVDNLDGYFSDFTENSLTNKLKKTSYFEFYLNINNTGWYKSWTMQFDSLTANNQNAKLIFKPYCSSIINTKQLYDKNKQFTTDSIWSLSELDTYFEDNYSMNIEQDNTNSGTIIINRDGSKSISTMLLECGSAVASLEKPQLLSIIDNKLLRYKKVVSGTLIDTLTDNEILEKPLITKENLEGIIKISKTTNISQSTSNWIKKIDTIIKYGTDVLVIYGEGFDMNNVSTNDITITGATLNSISHSTSGGTTYGPISNYLLLEISGNIGDRYSVEISSNLYSLNESGTHEDIYAKGNYENTDNFIKLNVFEVINTKYWEHLVDNLEKKIKLKIKALPWLQVGDIISIPDEGNIVIAEIHTSWSNGFIMNIIAYKINQNLI